MTWELPLPARDVRSEAREAFKLRVIGANSQMKDMNTEVLPHVVIIGGGFAGLSAARELAKAPVRVTLIDRSNHHVFQPLLYQVATAVLSPGEIAMPIRRILHYAKNVEVILNDEFQEKLPALGAAHA